MLLMFMMKNKWPVHLIYISIIFVFFVACYHNTITWIFGRYISPDSYYSHGFIVPLVTAFLIWQKRNDLMLQQPASSWWGLGIIICAVLLHLFGTIVYFFSISGFSIFVLIFGFSLFLFGKNITKTIFFPLLFTFFMFPLPKFIIDAASFPLKLFVAKAGRDIVSLTGIPVYQEGFNIIIPAGRLLVGNPCSGLRSLIAFLALGYIFAYLSRLSNARKLLLFTLTIPIAVFSNLLRVPLLILISNHWGLNAAAPDTISHTASGLVVFGVGLSLLFILLRLLGDSYGE